jgi:hypothetical protein
MRLPFSTQQYEGKFCNILHVEDCVAESTTQSIKDIIKEMKDSQINIVSLKGN